MKLTSFLAVGAMLAAGLCSCSNNEPGGDDNGLKGNPNTGTTPETPAQEKKHIEETATQLTQAFKPQDQEKLVNFGIAFAQEFSEFGFDGPAENVKKGINGISKAARTADWLGITRAIRQFTYDFSIGAGIYEPDYRDYTWKRTGDSADMIFKFTLAGLASEVRVAPSDGTWSLTVNGEWYDEDADEDYPAEYKFIIPKTLRVTVTWGTETLVDAVTKTSYSASAKTASADVDAKVANIRLTTTSSVTNTKAQATVKVAIGSLEVINAKATLNGNDLCNVDRYADIAEKYDDDEPSGDIHQLFRNGSSECNIMGRMFVEGTVNDISTLPSRIGECYEEDRNAAEAAAKYVNGKMKAVFYLGGAKSENGEFFWQAANVDDGWYGYEDWHIVPLMRFNSDNSVYTIDGYFNQQNFGNVVYMFSSLMDEYASYFGFSY